MNLAYNALQTAHSNKRHHLASTVHFEGEPLIAWSSPKSGIATYEYGTPILSLAPSVELTR